MLCSEYLWICQVSDTVCVIVNLFLCSWVQITEKELLHAHLYPMDFTLTNKSNRVCAAVSVVHMHERDLLVTGQTC